MPVLHASTKFTPRIAIRRLVITVSGSTGTIGSELVRLLSKAGAPTRALIVKIRVRPRHAGQ